MAEPMVLYGPLGQHVETHSKTERDALLKKGWALTREEVVEPKVEPVEKPKAVPAKAPKVEPTNLPEGAVSATIETVETIIPAPEKPAKAEPWQPAKEQWRKEGDR